mmetsp:Transcript_14276/g.38481  ORF Transcript_14276/g.38481 Transcript_14276/m.38481 type:complete len:259 (-) Transcript_14276:564-1340(-)
MKGTHTHTTVLQDHLQPLILLHLLPRRVQQPVEEEEEGVKGRPGAVEAHLRPPLQQVQVRRVGVLLREVRRPEDLSRLEHDDDEGHDEVLVHPCKIGFLGHVRHESEFEGHEREQQRGGDGHAVRHVCRVDGIDCVAHANGCPHDQDHVPEVVLAPALHSNLKARAWIGEVVSGGLEILLRHDNGGLRIADGAAWHAPAAANACGLFGVLRGHDVPEGDGHAKDLITPPGEGREGELFRGAKGAHVDVEDLAVKWEVL